MLLRTLNNPDRLMAPIDEETFDHLRETFGDDVLARDLTYLTSIGLVQADAAIIGADGMVHFNRGCMGLTAVGVWAPLALRLMRLKSRYINRPLIN
ncbi:hypothetical protein SGGMMB4_02606 [Sodalis glossinidius str. 'morsitans']|uniref:Uncharacterized protein n=1 Tax=Sodalis glossinidius (strain morsitans) TaxID=343509 RepID=A0A193QIS2_SODGM|nr:hypothetical protein SGGMMB4_02606 [Sodalis glossinidius str. 'morsitans']